MKKDKQKVIDELWSDERVKNFLSALPPAGVNRDFHCLLMAYRGMRVKDFQRFIGFFIAAARDLNALGPDGETILSIISGHRSSGNYAQVLRQAGAQDSRQI